MGQLASLFALGEATLTAAEAGYRPLVEQAAREAGVAPALVMAIIGRESGFQPSAVNVREPRGGPSMGLMQVQLATARLALKRPSLTEFELFDPLTNLRAGAHYLADQLRRYGDDIAAGVAAYNAGSAYRTAVGAFTNQAYVDDVLRRMGRYVAAGISGPGASLRLLAAVVGGAAVAGGAVWLVRRRRR